MLRLVPVVVLLAACSTAPPPRPATIARPDVAPLRLLPAGTRLGAALAPGSGDEPLHRAAAVWWREALRQSVTFDVVDTPTPRGLAVLELALEPLTQRLSAFLVEADGQRLALAGGTFAGGDLPAGIDRVAWACRLALGEDALHPVPIAAAVSRNPRATDAAHDGFLLLRDGGINAAGRAFLNARRADGASPYILDGLATIALLRRDSEQANRLAREGLNYESRLSPRTQHRLARTLLLAQAGRQPDRAPDRDRELLALGSAMQRERPHDPEGLLSIAIAENLLGEFASARPRLEQLTTLLPRAAIAHYHLGWACLATGDPAAALAAFEAAALRLPETWLTIPRAIAMHAAGSADALDRMLSRLVSELPPRDFTMVHEVHRMQAAHAILQGDRELAAAHLSTTLNWLLAHPTLLDTRAGQLADQGEVLVRLGRGDLLAPVLAAMQAQRPASVVADACAYLSGLVQVSSTRQRAITLEQRLRHDGESTFSLRLRAFAHELRGELADMHASLARTARLDNSVLVKALLARSLMSMGKTREGDALRTALRRELTELHLRRRPTHPLLGPEYAYAYRIE